MSRRTVVCEGPELYRGTLGELVATGLFRCEWFPPPSARYRIQRTEHEGRKIRIRRVSKHIFEAHFEPTRAERQARDLPLPELGEAFTDYLRRLHQARGGNIDEVASRAGVIYRSVTRATAELLARLTQRPFFVIGAERAPRERTAR